MYDDGPHEEVRPLLTVLAKFAVPVALAALLVFIKGARISWCGFGIRYIDIFALIAFDLPTTAMILGIAGILLNWIFGAKLRLTGWRNISVYSLSLMLLTLILFINFWLDVQDNPCKRIDLTKSGS